MPRKKVVQEDFMQSAVLALPPATRTGHKHEHQKNPYETLPGDIPGKFTVTEEKTQLKEPTPEDIAQRDNVREELRARAAIYHRYMELFNQHGGDKVAALCELYSMEKAEVLPRVDELHAEARLGIVTSDVGKVFEHYNVDLAPRIRKLSEHMYSEVPAASLSSIKLLNEMADDSNTAGSFEHWLRVSKGMKP